MEKFCISEAPKKPEKLDSKLKKSRFIMTSTKRLYFDIHFGIEKSLSFFPPKGKYQALQKACKCNVNLNDVFTTVDRVTNPVSFSVSSSRIPFHQVVM